jgi:hypothetical protein
MKCETHEPFEIERDLTGAVVRLHRLELDRLTHREEGWRYLADDGASEIVLPKGAVTWLPRGPGVDFPPGHPAQKEAPDNPWAGVALVTFSIPLPLSPAAAQRLREQLERTIRPYTSALVLILDEGATLQLHGANPDHPVGVLALTPDDVGLTPEEPTQ